MTKITAIIPTFNEEDNIQRALNSVSFADEIIVIDSFSTDKTVEIVKNNEKAILLQRKFDDFSTQKNYAIQQATHNWIFLLDADEEIVPKLKEEIIKTVKKPKNNIAFYVKRAMFFNKKRIYFSGFQNSKVKRLFLKNYCEYTGKVHEKLQCNGTVGTLSHKLNHYSYKSNVQYKKKLEHYAKLQAQELFLKEKKVTLFHLYIKPLARFVIHLTIKLGFLDGVKGVQLAYLHGYGVYKRYTELKKLTNYNHSNRKA